MEFLKKLLGDAYKDGMTLEEISSALEAKKVGEPIDLSGYVKKDVLDNATKDAAEWKKKYNAKLTDEEKAAADHQAVLDELAELKKANKIAEIKSGLIGQGYDDKLAADTAEAMYSGDFAKVIANQKTFQDARDAQNASNNLHNMNQPSGNNGGATDYGKTMQEAYDNNDLRSMAAAIEAQFNEAHPGK